MLGKATRDRSYLYHNFGLLTNITGKENFKIGKNDCQKAKCQIFQRKQAFSLSLASKVLQVLTK